MGSPVVEAYSPVLLTATANVRAAACSLGGIFVASTTAGTITVYDSATTGTGTKIVDTFSPNAGTYYPLPFNLNNGCYIVVGGTLSGTVALA